MAAESGRRCHYEVLGLPRECTADEIRSAYRKLALQLHPDKLVQSGLSQSEATAKFQELAQAYEILSDPKERAWYDSHRSQILFADRNSGDSVPDSVIPNLFSFFSNTVFSGYSDSKKGFYRVYSDVFNKIYANEINFARKLGLGLDSVREAPAMGNLESPYAQVTAFYGYWLGFSTVMDFCWVDQYDAMAGVNRKSRRVMEEENKKVRKKARREYNETVRGLAEFVKKRDKRVIDMAVKRNLEMKKRKEEERERKKRMERDRLERAMAYEEPEWSRVAEEDEEEENWVEEVDEKKNGKELYCVVCGKKFKSEKQWKNHEQSKKHREKVAEFRESIGDDEFEDDLVGEGQVADDGVEELGEKMRDGVRISEDEEVELSNGDDDEFGEVGVSNGINEDGEKAGSDAEEDDNENGENGDHGDEDNVVDEIGVLEAMLGRRKNRKKHGSLRHETNGTSTNVHVESDDDEFMDYNKRKTTRRNRRAARKERSGKNGEEAVKDERNGASTSEQNKESNEDENLHCPEESPVAENGSNGKEDDPLADKKKGSNQNVDKKGNNAKNDANAKSKNSSKGKKSKVK